MLSSASRNSYSEMTTKATSYDRRKTRDTSPK
jgi:hypothetical protein